MKNSIILALAVLLASVASVTLVNTSQYSIALTIEKNDANSTNSNVTIALTTPSTFMTDSYFSQVVCVNTGVSSFALSATTASLRVFALTYQWSGTCNAVSELDNAFTIETTTSTYTLGTDAFSTDTFADQTGTITIGTGTDTNNTSFPSNIQKFLSVTPALMSGLNLPNQSQTFHLRCFANFDQSADTVTDSTVSLATTFAAQGNATLGGNAAQITGLFALVGSFVFASLI